MLFKDSDLNTMYNAQSILQTSNRKPFESTIPVISYCRDHELRDPSSTCLSLVQLIGLLADRPRWKLALVEVNGHGVTPY